jgi:hypothetical protein
MSAEISVNLRVNGARSPTRSKRDGDWEISSVKTSVLPVRTCLANTAFAVCVPSWSRGSRGFLV